MVSGKGGKTLVGKSWNIAVVVEFRFPVEFPAGNFAFKVSAFASFRLSDPRT